MIFLSGMAGAGLADVVDIRLLVVASSVLLFAAGLVTAVLPGRRPPGRRVAPRASRAAPRAGRGGRRHPGPARDARRLRPAGRPICRRFGRLGDPQRARSSPRRRSARSRPGRGSSSTATSATRPTSSSTAEPRPGRPEPDGGYRGLSTMARRRLLRRDRGADRQPPHRGRRGRRADTTLLEVPADDAARADGRPRDRPARSCSTLNERLNRTNNADLPRLAGVDQAST